MSHQEYILPPHFVNPQQNILDYDVNIPTSILFMPGVSRTDLKLYSIIKSLTRTHGYCFATNEYLGAKMGMSPRNIQKYLARLKKICIIEVEVRRWGKQTDRKIWLCDRPRERQNVHALLKAPSYKQPVFKEKFKHVPFGTGGDVPFGTPILGRGDEKEITFSLEKERDKEKEANRKTSFDEHHFSSSLPLPSAHLPSEGKLDIKPYDWETFRLADGKFLSRRMKLALMKYKPWEVGELMEHVNFYIMRCSKGYQPKDGNHEKYLQVCIKYKYGTQHERIQNNKLLAELFVEEQKFLKREAQIYKTRVSFIDKRGEQWSILFEIPEDEFIKQLERFRKK